MNKRTPASALGLTAAILVAWIGHEGFTAAPTIPTKGDVATIGHGATHYEDGRRVTMADPPITRQRAGELAANLLQNTYLACVKRSLGDTPMHPVEFEQAVDFAGQYGCTNWWNSTMRAQYVAGNYGPACQAYLRYKFAAGYDCSTPGNKRCMGVWTRQLARHAACTGVL
ncbi:glycoside hydrolase family protein [Comamonas terrigena]|uniref:glycoside hydrolase family protein n=1 Tax=Comamonas terrigena TaxID=32013 RepID=UPI0028ABA4CB|nr:lysozyme [Comamonas terrigena]